MYRKGKIQPPRRNLKTVTARGTPELVAAIRSEIKRQYPSHTQQDVVAAIWASYLGLEMMLPNNPVVKGGKIHK